MRSGLSATVPSYAGECRIVADRVVSRLVATLAADLPRALKAIRAARASALERAWALAGVAAPGGDGGLVAVDLDATIVIAHPEKERRERAHPGAQPRFTDVDRPPWPASCRPGRRCSH
jgi:hypothetical protein